MASSPEDKENVLPPPSEPDMAFLNHSQTTLLKQLPPDVDNKRLVRQRRRRTSPEDQKILEDVYQRNPRPDRAARAALAEKVSLGNKELQIWFQNRRQSDRRRSRPIPDGEPSSSASLNSESDRLSDHPFSSSSGSEDADQSAGSIKSSPQLECASVSRDEGKQDTAPQEQAATSDLDIQNVPSSLNQESQGYPSLFSSISNVSLESMVTIPNSQEPSSQPEKQTTGYIANRRGASFLQQERASEVSHQSSVHLTSRSPVTNANEESQTQRTRALQRTASLRLSTTADGKARIIDENNPSPSPPRVASPPTSNTFNDPPIRPPQLRRSLSAVTPSLSASFPAQNTGRTLLRTESGHGRSRDSRAWAFWCDAEERNSLQTQALAESSGSAASAIGLIRDRRRHAEEREKQAAQKAATGKRGLVDPSSQGQSKRLKRSSDQGRSGFQRSHSSIPRLSSSTPRALGPKSSAMNINPSDHVNVSRDGKMAKPGEVQMYTLEDSDGDKENWLPGTRTSAPRHPHTPADASRFRAHPLAENLRELSEAVGFGTPAATRKGRTLSSASSASGAGERPLSVGSCDDLDCVEGLLKLRGGTWG